MNSENEICRDFAIHENDTGSSSYQIALLTNRISRITGHLKAHPKDFHTHRGLLKLIGRRRSLLIYLKRRNVDLYSIVIKRLGIKR